MLQLRTLGVEVGISAALVACFVSWGAAQSVRRVPSQYPTIGQAIAAANGGDTVLVAPETYAENLNYRGKNVAVRSEHGPWVTAIVGSGRTSVVTMTGGEGPAAVLEGFTVTSGYANKGGGITIGRAGAPAAPTIRNNIIRDNTAYTYTYYPNDPVGSPGEGAGIYCIGPALITGNLIFSNRIPTFRNPPWVIIDGRGAGLYCEGGTRVENNVIVGNSSPLSSVRVEGIAWLINDTIVNNQAGVEVIGEGYCANCIVRGNGPVQFNVMTLQGRPPAILTIWHGNVAGGRNGVAGGQVVWGPGMIDVSPNYVDAANLDFHLRADSPGVDAGTTLGLVPAAVDMDGDRRIENGVVDIGADEFGPRVYSAGIVRPGGAITIRVVGAPGAAVVLGISTTILPAPITVPGLGDLHIGLGTALLVPLATLGPDGSTSYTLVLPVGFPIADLGCQALIGAALSNFNRIPVR